MVYAAGILYPVKDRSIAHVLFPMIICPIDAWWVLEEHITLQDSASIKGMGFRKHHIVNDNRLFGDTNSIFFLDNLKLGSISIIGNVWVRLEDKALAVPIVFLTHLFIVLSPFYKLQHLCKI